MFKKIKSKKQQKMSYIQLPDKIVDKVEQIQLNLPKDQKAKDLFAHLPYIANLQDPIL